MKREINVSIIIPVYNGEKYLRETIDNVLASSLQTIEVILVDDGSTDSSSRICQKKAAEDDRIQYVRQENGGIVSARNTGLQMALGKYVCFCDQDDIIEPDMYRLLFSKMEKNQAQAGICGTGRYMNGQKSLYEKTEEGIYRGEESYKNLLYPVFFAGYDMPFMNQNVYIYGTVWKGMFLRSFLMKEGIFWRKFIHYEDDWNFMIESLLKAKITVSVDKTLYYWRINQQSESHHKRYLERMKQKVEAHDAFVLPLLQCYLPEDICRLAQKKLYCEHYIELVQNLACSANKGSDKGQLLEYIKSTNGRECIKDMLTYMKKGVLRKRKILECLEKDRLQSAVRWNNAVWRLEYMAGYMQWAVKLERKMKMKMRKKN